ncbi:hypothetical protein BKA93DRAFT_753352 [Sparassis latifolia]
MPPLYNPAASAERGNDFSYVASRGIFTKSVSSMQTAHRIESKPLLRENALQQSTESHSSNSEVTMWSKFTAKEWKDTNWVETISTDHEDVSQCQVIRVTGADWGWIMPPSTQDLQLLAALFNNVTELHFINCSFAKTDMLVAFANSFVNLLTVSVRVGDLAPWFHPIAGSHEDLMKKMRTELSAAVQHRWGAH